MRTFGIQWILAIALLSGVIIGCDGDAKTTEWPQNLPTTQMSIAGQPFTIEIANDDKEREIGLMKRDAIPADRGMIFVFPEEAQRTFWMKNTRIDLDILYLKSDGVIDSIATMRAYDLSGAPSKGPAKYAIELNSGMVEKLHIKVGDKVEIPAPAKETSE